MGALRKSACDPDDWLALRLAMQLLHLLQNLVKA
jgi:hypothetical protein